MHFQAYRGPSEGAELILAQDLGRYYICSADDSGPLHLVLASILRFYAKDSESWKAVIRTLLRHGAVVRAPVRQGPSCLDQSEYMCPVAPYGTSLDELFRFIIDPLEGQEVANGWLQILASEGHDILVYLETESALHQRPIQFDSPILSYYRLRQRKQARLPFGSTS